MSDRQMKAVAKEIMRSERYGWLFEWGTPDAVAHLAELLTHYTSEAYKRGYIQGGVDEILRHERARNEVMRQVEDNQISEGRES